MNLRPKNTRQNPASESVPQGMFFHAADRALCDFYCSKIVTEAKSLAIVASSEAIAEHYCSLIIQCLRTIPDVQLHLHQAPTTERLLDSFNEILSSLSTAEAMSGRNLSAPLRILVAGATDLLNPEVNRLLVRLITGFPGANTQVIVLQAGRGAESSLNIPSSHLVRWVVAEPSRAEATALLTNARAVGNEAEVIDLLNRVAPGLSDQSLEPKALRDRESEYEPVPAAVTAIPQLGMSKGAAKKGRGRSKLFFGFKGMALVIISFLILAPFFPRQIMSFRDALSGLGQAVASAIAQAQSPSSPRGTNSEGTRATAASPQDAAHISSSKTETDHPSVVAVGQQSEGLSAAAGAPLSQPAEAHSSTAVTAPKETRQKSEAEIVSAGPSISLIQKAIARISAAQKSSVFVQHVAMDTYAAAHDWQLAHKALVEALIVPVKPSAGAAIKYVVVSGPFGSAASATEFSKKDGVPPAPWLRSATSLVNTLAVTD